MVKRRATLGALLAAAALATIVTASASAHPPLEDEAALEDAPDSAVTYGPGLTFQHTALAALASCSSGARTLSLPGARVYPDQGNGGYTSLHTDLHIAYDTEANLFLPGTRADLTIRTTQCLTDFSFDFERTNLAGSLAGPNMTVTGVTIDGAAGRVRLPAADLSGEPERAGRSRPGGTRDLERQPGERDEPEPARVLAADGQQLPERPTVPREQARDHALDADRGRPDDHGDDRLRRPARPAHGRRRLDGGLVPRQHDRGAERRRLRHDGARREHGLDAAQQPPDRQADLRRLRHRPGRQDGDRARRARRRDARPRPSRRSRPPPSTRPTRTSPAARGRGTGTRRSRSRATSWRTASRRTTSSAASAPTASSTTRPRAARSRRRARR